MRYVAIGKVLCLFGGLLFNQMNRQPAPEVIEQPPAIVRTTTVQVQPKKPFISCYKAPTSINDTTEKTTCVNLGEY